MSQLTNIFLGARWRGLWIAAVCALHVSAMWTCCAIWVNCAEASIGGSPRVIWLACCAVLLPLSCAGGTAVVQPPLAVATLATLVLMVCLLGWAAFSPETAVFATPLVVPPRDVTLLIDAEHFGGAVATFLFSHIAQQSVPSLVRSAAQPELTRSALAAAVLTCCVLYLLLGTLAAIVFGGVTSPLITLNFAHFTGGAFEGLTPPWWARILSQWIMLLPLLTTTAAFPLFNGVLASNLVALLPPKWMARTWRRRGAALLCALPSVLATAVVRSTPFLFSLCGLSGFAIVFFVPAALQRAARHASVARWGAAGRDTPHTTVFSDASVVFAIAALGGAAFVFALFQNVRSWM